MFRCVQGCAFVRDVGCVAQDIETVRESRRNPKQLLGARTMALNGMRPPTGTIGLSTLPPWLKLMRDRGDAVCRVRLHNVRGLRQSVCLIQRLNEISYQPPRTRKTR